MGLFNRNIDIQAARQAREAGRAAKAEREVQITKRKRVVGIFDEDFNELLPGSSIDATLVEDTSTNIKAGPDYRDYGLDMDSLNTWGYDPCM